MAEENAARRDWYEERSDGSLDFPHFLSAARRLALEVRRASGIHGLGGMGCSSRPRGQRVLSAEEREESRIEEGESVERLEKDSRGGREAVTLVAREEGEREWRLRRTVTVQVGGEGGRWEARGIEKEMKW